MTLCSSCEQEANVYRRSNRPHKPPFYRDDATNRTLVKIRSNCRQLKRRVSLTLVVIVNLQFMTSGKKVETRRQEAQSSPERSSS
ncbi:DnaB-like helicase C-terminal domain-containing protein [Herbiconiux flava]|uniref:DnaB-like helicase C-terminal domain-containing protein n=1 Tax=Herbiconiux flava TaxID=881268 RepID=UPI0035A234E3